MLPRRIEHPDEPDARAQPLAHLLKHLTWSVLRREDLSDQVGRYPGVALLRDLCEPVAVDEREVRGPHSVGIALDLEARVLSEDLAPGVNPQLYGALILARQLSTTRSGALPVELARAVRVKTYRMYGATLLAIVRNSASVSGSLRNSAHASLGGRLPPVAPSDP